MYLIRSSYLESIKNSHNSTTEANQIKWVQMGKDWKTEVKWGQEDKVGRTTGRKRRKGKFQEHLKIISASLEEKCVLRWILPPVGLRSVQIPI